MGENTRIKININTGEFEIEGTEDFVKNQLTTLPEMVEKISGALPKRTLVHQHSQTESFPKDQSLANNPLIPKPENNDVINSLPDNFGEWYNKFPSKIQQVDLFLIAGYFKQKKSDDNAFETNEVTDLLKEQGIKLSNPAVFAKLLQQSKLAIIIGKRGKLNRFRISPDGESRIKDLMQPQ